LGFGNGASNYFTISAVVVNSAENNKKLKKIVETVIRRKLNYRNTNKELELKGAKTSIGIKKYFYKKCKSIDFEIYAITILKKNVKEDLRNEKSKLYNYILKFLFGEIQNLGNYKSLIIHLDKCKNKKEIKDCDNYLASEIKERCPEISLKINHSDSVKTKQLQVVDMFCHGIARKYNQKDEEWLSIFEDKVLSEELFFKKEYSKFNY
jgi:hypothetical protein